MVRVCTALAGLVLGLGLAPAAARAQNPGANDPGAGSPAGTIYQIPLDTARHDAAPRGRGGSGGGNGGDVSPIRSNNNFGSSSTVPGAGASGGGAGSSGSSGQGAGGAGSSGSSAGSGKAGGTRPAGGSATTRSNDRRAGNREALIRSSIHPSVPSSTRTYLLIALGIAVALALGVAGRVVLRRR